MQDLRYLGLKMFDVPQTNIAKYFDEANDFIEEAVAGNGKRLGTVIISLYQSWPQDESWSTASWECLEVQH